MLNALIIVWRESLEALLIIAILLSWSNRQTDPAPLRRGLGLGAVCGLLLAGLLALFIATAHDEFSMLALEKIQAGMVLFAAALIVHMVLWMHRQGRTMRAQLESQASKAPGALGIAAIVALAVAREGAETVIFLQGTWASTSAASLPGLAAAIAAGFGLALLTLWTVARGTRRINLRVLFAISEIALLFIAHALLAAGIDRLIANDWLPALIDPVWDSAAWLDDSQGMGRILADFAGYRARPAATLLIFSCFFWAFTLWQLYGRTAWHNGIARRAHATNIG